MKTMINKIFFICAISIYACLAGPVDQILTAVEARNCPSGFYCVSDDRLRSVTPQACPPGTYSGVGASICTPCRSGYWTIRYGSSYCDICPIGHLCPNASSAPQACPLGTANPSLGQTDCFPCAAGDYTPTLQSPACAACPNGYYCGEAADQPKQCPAGKYDFINNIYS